MNVRQAVSVGLASVRENRVPMVVLWASAAVTVLLYGLSPAFCGLMESLAGLQVKGGYFAALLNRLVFCGIVPGSSTC